MIFHFLSTTSNISGGRIKNIIFTAYISSGSKGGKAHLILIITEKNKETLPKFTFPARIVTATRTEISCKLMRKTCFAVNFNTKAQKSQARLQEKKDVRSQRKYMRLLVMRLIFSTGDQKWYSHHQLSKNSNLMRIEKDKPA